MRFELIKSSISYLKGRSFKLYPDFSTGGFVDITNYNDGKRGGKIRLRSKIEELDNNYDANRKVALEFGVKYKIQFDKKTIAKNIIDIFHSK